MVKVGDKIRIINMNGESHYNGKIGEVKSINEDPWGDTQVWGTWGGCCLYLGVDSFEIID